MKVPGFLRLTTLGDVLGGIFREGASGVLELSEAYGTRAGMVHRVHLVSGAVVHVESAFAGTRLGDVLLQRGLIDPARLRRCAAQLTVSTGVRFGDLLLQSRALSEFALNEALRIQRNERLERLFELTDAKLSFHMARIHAGREALSPPVFLHGRKRYRDRTGQPAVRREPLRTALPGDGHAGAHHGHAGAHHGHAGAHHGHAGAHHEARGAGRHEAHVAMRRDPSRVRALSTLGLDGAADSATVKRAFRDLARSLHPDCHPSASLAERAELMRRFAEITAAYHALVA
jgi:DnaJ-domain-containing protein 1